MENTIVPPSIERHSLRTSAAILVAGCLLTGSAVRAQPVNLLRIPLTNNAPGLTTISSDTSLGGVSVNLTMLDAVGTATNLCGLAGSGVNGVVTGVAALCLTNGAGGVQPASGDGGRALDNNDSAIGFGTLTNFVITMWINQLAIIADNVGPRLFVLNAGATAADDTANSIAVKFQANNELNFEINTVSNLGTAQYNVYPANKWLFFAFVYDGANLYEYDGTDSQAAQQVSKVATSSSQAVNLGGSASLMLGDRGSLHRGLDGWMEDFRLYKGISTNNASFVESVREQIARTPIFTDIYPDGAALMQATNTFVFTAQSTSGFNLTNIGLILNGVDASSGCTFVTNGAGSTNVTASYAGLPQQTVNTAVVSAIDALGLAGAASVAFDTFSFTNFIIEAEEFDFGGGQFISSSDYTDGNPADSNSYWRLDSVEGIDTHKGTSAGDAGMNQYRYDDGSGARTQTGGAKGELPWPKFANLVDASNVPISGHVVGYWSSGEWQNYTKSIPAGKYNVFGRLSARGGSVVTLSQVTGGWGTAIQTTSNLGAFMFSGNSFTSYQWAPLRDSLGNLAVVGFTGPSNTVRATTGGGANADFYMLVPVKQLAPANQFTEINIGSQANINIQTYTHGTNYPLGGTQLNVAGVPFALAELGNNPKTTGVVQSPGGGGLFSYAFAVPTGTQARILYILMNNEWGNGVGLPEASIVVTGTGGETATLNFVEGANIRDHNDDGFVNTLSDPSVVSTYFLNGTTTIESIQTRFDRQTLALPPTFDGDTVASITFTGTALGNPGGSAFLAGLTLSDGDVPQPALNLQLASGDFVLSWTGLTNVTYDVQVTTNLSGIWTTLGSISSTQTNFTLTEANTNQCRFYRLVVP